jgi:hypothetical protein
MWAGIVVAMLAFAVAIYFGATRNQGTSTPPPTVTVTVPTP